jgi:hypothetical protein
LTEKGGGLGSLSYRYSNIKVTFKKLKIGGMTYRTKLFVMASCLAAIDTYGM